MSNMAIASFRSRLAMTSIAVGLAAAMSIPAFAARTVRLQAGSVIPVRLNDKLSSDESRKGDRFTATVRSREGEDYGLPEGTKVDGVVTGVRPQRDNDPGVIDLAFRRVSLPDGRSYPIQGSLIGLDNQSVDRRPDGRLVARPGHRNDHLTYAGYGAGAGLIVGMLTKHPIEDALLGGLLGYGYSALQNGHNDARNVVLDPGTEMGVRLDRQAVFTTYDQSDNDHRYRYSDESRYHEQDNGDRVEARQNDRDWRDRAAVGVMIGDRDVRFDSAAQPIINQNDIVLVPLVPVLRAAHVPFTYYARTQTLRATGTGEPVRLSVGSDIAVQDGRRIRLDGTVQRINGTLYAPMRALALATGDDVRYDSGSRTVVITPQ